MANLKGTRTEKNLMAAFAGESQARNRYTYFASQAQERGLVQIADIFEETANQEKEHAKRFFKFLEGGEVEIAAAFPAGVIGTTLENLKAAAAGEHHEWTTHVPGLRQDRPTRRASGRGRGLPRRSRSRRSSTRSATSTWRPTSKPAACSRATPRWSGAAATAATCTRAPSAPSSARPALHPQAHFELLGENW